MVSPWALPVIVKPSLCRPRSIVTADAASAADTASTLTSASSSAAFRPAEVAASVSVSVPPPPSTLSAADEADDGVGPEPGVDHVRAADEPVMVSPWALPVIVKPSLCRPRSIVTADRGQRRRHRLDPGQRVVQRRVQTRRGRRKRQRVALRPALDIVAAGEPDDGVRPEPGVDHVRPPTIP